MELSITKEKVLEAADKCPQAKETLKTLFPEVFTTQEIKPFQVTSNQFEMIYIAQSHAPQGLYGKCFGLDTSYDWVIVPHGEWKILIPTKK